MNRFEIFKYKTFPELIAGWIKWLAQENAKYSIRWVARKLGLKSHAHLHRILNGEKIPSPDLVSRIATLMKLTVDEFTYLRLLAEICRAKSTEERSFLIEKLEVIQKNVPDFLLQFEAFELIAKWHHLAIFELLALPDFSEDPKWLAQKIRGITPEEAAASLARLEKLEIVKRVDGKLTRAVGHLTTPHNIPNTAIRKFHADLLDSAKEALDAVPIEKRYFLGHTMPFDSKKMAEAENLMLEFRRRFHALLESGSPDSVYHLSIQFIPLTTP